MSYIPMRLALIIIFGFGLIPAILFFGFQYLRMVEDLKAEGAKHLKMVQRELHLNADFDIKLFNTLAMLEEKRFKKNLESLTGSLESLMENVRSRFRDLLSHEDLTDMTGEVLNGMRELDENHSFFIYSLDGVLQASSSPLPALQGERGKREGLGPENISKIIELAKKEKKGFLQFKVPVSGEQEGSRHKIVHIRLFAPLGWVIAVGDFWGSPEKKIQKEVIAVKRQRNMFQQGRNFVMDQEMNLLVGDRNPGSNSFGLSGLDAAIAGMDQDILRSSGEIFWFSGEKISPEGESRMIPMMGFAHHYAPWGWTSGETMSVEAVLEKSVEIQAQLKEKIIQDILISILVFSLAVSFVFIIGKYYAGVLEKNLEEFDTFFNKAGDQKEKINLERVRFEELKALGLTANAMVNQRALAQEWLQKVNLKLRDANRRLREIADIDGLTQIANRRTFDQALKREWARAAREETCLALAMLDIDYFKLFNDTYGHQMGDDCLIRVAAVMKGSVRRPTDLVARYGGEEFVVLLPSTDISGGKKICEQIQDQISKLAIPHAESKLGRVSLSMGLAEIFPGPGIDGEILIKAADEALYRAKEGGRNKIESAPDIKKE